MHPPGGDPPSRQPPPRSRPPWSRHPLPGDPLGSRHPQEQATAPHPPEQASPGRRQPPRSSPPPVNRITDTCKNITFATSLRTVITSSTIKIILRTLNSLEINTQTQPRRQRILKALIQHRNNRNSITHSHSFVQDL